MNNPFVTSQSFKIPHYLAPSAWAEHIPFAFELVKKIKPGLIVELGVYQGVSYFSFCQAVREDNPGARCYGVDTWGGDEHTSFYNESIFERVNTYNNATYQDFSQLKRCLFEEALSSFEDKSIDLLHIDGLHTYEAVKNDFETWLPKLSDSAIVLFHDSAVRDRGFGVYLLWEELSAIYPSFSFLHGYGLGVLATGKNIPPEMQSFFQSSEADITQLRSIYSRLGILFTEQLKTEQLREATDELETVRARVVQLQEEVETLGAWGRRSNEELEQLRQNKGGSIRAFSATAPKVKVEDGDTQSHLVYRLEAEKKELEATLMDIYSSDGYRLLSVYYRLKAKFLPENSGRHQKLKAFGRFLKTKTILSRLGGKTPSPKFVRGQVFKPQVPAGISFPVVFPIVEEPLVSIIIPAFNNWAFTRNCILSIYEHTQGISYEIIVGDNVSTDETINFEKYFTNINYIRNPENLGYILNINNAASHARGKFILTLNNDTTVTPNWLSSMLDVMDRDEKVGLVGSKLVFPDGTLQEAGGIVWKDASGWNYGRDGNPDAPEYNYLKEVDYISGASNLVRKEVWTKLNGLDERYIPAYFDDSDLAFGIRQLGYKTIYQPLSVVIHYEGLTHGTSTNTGTKKYQVVNAGKFVEKWKSTLEKENFANGKQVFHARDKSGGKKTIVVIDHYVPQFDKDAGSRTTFKILQLLVKHNYNVKFIGDNFSKHEPYTTILQQMGIEVLYGEWYREGWKEWIVQNKEYIDFFYINRPHISIKYIDLIREKTKAKIIYYGHDLHFVREQRQYEIEKDPALLESAEKWKKTEAELIRKSDIAFTVSTLEKEVMLKEFGPKDIRIIPIYYYDHFNPPVTNFNERRDLLFVGGFNHKPNVDAILWFVKEVFPLISRELKDIRVIVAGSNPPKEVSRLASSKIQVKGYISDQELHTLYQTVKMAVIPLRYGAGVKGKTVESIYFGIPFVTTSFGIEGLPDISEVTTSHDTAAAFADRVIELYNDNTQQLAEFSRKEIDYVIKHFSEENSKNVILNAFK